MFTIRGDQMHSGRDRQRDNKWCRVEVSCRDYIIILDLMLQSIDGGASHDQIPS